MFSVLSAVLEPFLLIALGYALRGTKRFGAKELWDGVEKLVFWVLFPPLLFNSVAHAKLTGLDTAEFLLFGTFAMATGVFMAKAVSKMAPADPMTGLPAPRRFALPAAAAWPLARSDRPAIPGPFHDAANTSPVPPRHSGPQKKPRVKHPRLLACRQPAGIRRPARWSGSASCSAPHRSRGSGWPAESRLRSRRCRQRPAATPATDLPPP